MISVVLMKMHIQERVAMTTVHILSYVYVVSTESINTSQLV